VFHLTRPVDTGLLISHPSPARLTFCSLKPWTRDGSLQVRAGLASMGLRSLDELVGRADMLKQRDMALAKTDGLDLSFITTYAGETGKSSTRRAQCVPSSPCLLASATTPTWQHAATLFIWTPFGDSKQFWGCREREPLSERDSFLVS